MAIFSRVFFFLMFSMRSHRRVQFHETCAHKLRNGKKFSAVDKCVDSLCQSVAVESQVNLSHFFGLSLALSLADCVCQSRLCFSVRQFLAVLNLYFCVGQKMNYLQIESLTYKNPINHRMPSSRLWWRSTKAEENAWNEWKQNAFRSMQPELYTETGRNKWKSFRRSMRVFHRLCLNFSWVPLCCLLHLIT